MPKTGKALTQKRTFDLPCLTDDPDWRQLAAQESDLERRAELLDGMS